ncbi:MAG: ATP-binding protein [Pseudomonadota bacterium]
MGELLTLSRLEAGMAGAATERVDLVDLVAAIADDARFEPFYRSDGTQAAGFGLGLAIARRAVEAHGGTIAAANRPDGGLCVDIRLPLAGGAQDARRQS